MLSLAITPRRVLAAGEIVNNSKLNDLGYPVAAFSGQLENAQITDNTIATAKLTAAARKFMTLGTFNVTDPAYGATGDGVTDDSAAIQAAIDAAEVAGGTVFFPPPSAHYFTGTTQFTIDPASTVSIQLLGLGTPKIRSTLDARAATKTLFAMGQKLENFKVSWLWFYADHPDYVADSGFFHNGFSWTFGQATADMNNITFSEVIWSNFQREIVLVCGAGYNAKLARRLLVDGCSFLSEKGIDSSSTHAAVTAYEDLYEAIFTNNLFDGCTQGHVSTSTAKSVRDGFIWIRQPQNCVIANNLVKHFAIEGIFLLGYTGVGYPATTDGADTIVIANNVVNGTMPDDAVPPCAYAGIVSSVSRTLITGNKIRNCNYGIHCYPVANTHKPHWLQSVVGNYITMPLEPDQAQPIYASAASPVGIFFAATNGTATGGRSLCSQNFIEWPGPVVDFTPTLDAVHAAIWCEAKNVVVQGNMIVAFSKAGGTTSTVGIYHRNGSDNNAVKGNTFIGLDYGFYAGQNGATPLRADDNEFIDVTIRVDAGSAAADYYGRSRIGFTPTQTGWHRVLLSGGAAYKSGTLRIDVPRDVNNYTSGQSTVVALAMTYNNTSGYGKGRQELKQISHAGDVGGAQITAIRIADNAALDVYVNTITNAMPVTITLDSAAPGVMLEDPIQLSARQAVTASATRATLTFDNHAISLYSDAGVTNVGHYAAGYEPAAIATTTRYRASNVAELAFAAAHGFVVGDVVTISGFTGGNTAFNASNVPITQVNSATTLAYANTGADVTPAAADTNGRVAIVSAAGEGSTHQRGGAASANNKLYVLTNGAWVVAGTQT